MLKQKKAKNENKKGIKESQVSASERSWAKSPKTVKCT
jgi:hypothetical protein